MAHSPAPWSWFEHQGDLVVIPDDGTGRHRDGICGVNLCSVPKHSQAAEDNVQLIASAPEILKALLNPCHFVDYGQGPCGECENCARIKAAIAKATAPKEGQE